MRYGIVIVGYDDESEKVLEVHGRGESIDDAYDEARKAIGRALQSVTDDEAKR